MNKNNDLAVLYINEQPYTGLYPLKEALCAGTVFPQLNKPYGK